MTSCPTIDAGDIEIGEELTLWDVMHGALRAKEFRPADSVPPTILVLKSREIVATIAQSCEDPKILLIRSASGIRQIALNWCDVIQMLYRTSFLTLQKMEASEVIFFGERKENDGSAALFAMKWSARQFLTQPPRGSLFPETNDSIVQAFCLLDEKVSWISEVNTALQFSF